MSAQHGYHLQVRWTGAGESGTSSYTAYSRDHDVTLPGRPPLPGSADPAFRGDPTRYSPEELFVASLAQCHMLWFLHLAAAAGVVVREYVDDASGSMRVESGGEGQFTDVTLRPRVTVDVVPDGARPDDAALTALHRRAHDHCFLARSVNFPVHVEPAPPHVASRTTA
ncbi:OsmC family protein [Luteimicrobium subarcticum]|uniref:Organic hydroperoxide reductase OsmC/OhrA n=1 Tax=Luteimicrobium subarcticum TaxID=620910 RepID=A0A2M8W3G3_9MICO|nr:OsmC family protein [Luteimicrobium subarcticum]PJI85439.1 organic hydroperoxide reductase OsmC/OhrA [Luteimicrobium subarcticum]